MRIVGGSLRGRRLRAPAGARVRPTAERAREALFDILIHGGMSAPLEGALVVDLFAGTGALGLEALSRGAARLTAVESEADVRGILRANIEAWAAPRGRRSSPPTRPACSLRSGPAIWRCWTRPIAPGSRRRRLTRSWTAAGWTMRQPSSSSTRWTTPSSHRRHSRCGTAAATERPASPSSRVGLLQANPARLVRAPRLRRANRPRPPPSPVSLPPVPCPRRRSA